MQSRPNREGRLVKIDSVVQQVARHSCQTLHRLIADGGPLQLTSDICDRLSLAEAVRDIAEVAQCTGLVTLENVGCQILAVATPDGTDEVREVILLGVVEGPDEFAIGRKQ